MSKPEMNLVDRVIDYFAPVASRQRMAARLASKVQMNYDAASRSRRTNAWKAPSTSGDSAASGQRELLRYRSRDFIRNRPLAARGQSVITSNVVGGAGIVPSVECDEDDRKPEIRQLIKAHLMTTAIDVLGEMTLPMMQRTVMNATFGDGEILARRRWRTGRFGEGLELPFQVQLMEVDHLDLTKREHGKNQVIDGIEIGPTGRIEAYHLYRRHPGDATWWSMQRFESERVPASEIIHVRRFDRPGQLRGVPWMAPVMLPLGDLSDYQEAEIVKQKIAGLLVGVVKTANPKDDENYEPLTELMPGSIGAIGHEDDVIFNDPPSVSGFRDFMSVNARHIAVALGVTYEALTGDLSGVNFSSGRMGRMEMDRNIETWQQQIIVAQFCRGIETWLMEAVNIVGRDLPEFSLTWTAPRRALIDPSKEIPAAIKEIESGLTSRSRKQRELGYDPDVIQGERLEDQDRDKELGDDGGAED